MKRFLKPGLILFIIIDIVILVWAFNFFQVGETLFAPEPPVVETHDGRRCTVTKEAKKVCIDV